MATLGEQLAPAQIAVSVPELMKLAAPPWVDAVVGVVPSIVKYGALPAVLQVIVAETGCGEAPPAGSRVGAAHLAGQVVACQTPPQQ